MQTPPTTSLCTADCSSDDDCADGERRNTGDTGDARCKGGFVCKVAETVGDFCCRRLCVCTDFLQQEPAHAVVRHVDCPTSASRPPANKALCKNIQ